MRLASLLDAVQASGGKASPVGCCGMSRWSQAKSAPGYPGEQDARDLIELGRDGALDVIVHGCGCQRTAAARVKAIPPEEQALWERGGFSGDYQSTTCVPRKYLLSRAPSRPFAPHQMGGFRDGLSRSGPQHEPAPGRSCMRGAKITCTGCMLAHGQCGYRCRIRTEPPRRRPHPKGTHRSRIAREQLPPLDANHVGYSLGEESIRTVPSRRQSGSLCSIAMQERPSAGHRRASHSMVEGAPQTRRGSLHPDCTGSRCGHRRAVAGRSEVGLESRCRPATRTLASQSGIAGGGVPVWNQCPRRQGPAETMCLHPIICPEQCGDASAEEDYRMLRGELGIGRQYIIQSVVAPCHAASLVRNPASCNGAASVLGHADSIELLSGP